MTNGSVDMTFASDALGSEPDMTLAGFGKVHRSCLFGNRQTCQTPVMLPGWMQDEVGMFLSIALANAG